MLSLAADTALAVGPGFLDPERIISSLGAFAVVGVCAIVFAECGLLVGFFLPGDSLLFIAGLLVASGAIKTPLWLLCALIAACAIAGNLAGYAIGYRVGPRLFNRPDSRLFRRDHVEKTHAFFERYGARAIVLARFVPIVRTFITAMAGVGRMDFRAYAIYSAIGGLIWGVGVTVLGYFLGSVTFVKDNIDYIAVVIVALSVIPIGLEVLRARRASSRD